MHKTLKYFLRFRSNNQQLQYPNLCRSLQSFMNSNPNIFTDPNSPFATAPERVKKVLLQAKQNEKLNTAAIDLDNLGFQLKPTGNNFCSHFFGQTEQFYVCSCGVHARYHIRKYFCGSCWEPQKHVGHNYRTEKPSCDRAYCDCGRIQRFKKLTFCSKHSAYGIIKQCVIPEKEGNEFKQTVQSLLQCAIYQQLDLTFLDKILSFLNKVNENSIFYNRLTFDIIVKSSKFIKNQNVDEFEGQNTFLLILSKCREQDKFAKFIVKIGGDLLTRINTVKHVCGLCDRIGYQNLKNYFDEGTQRELISVTAIQKLLQQSFVHNLFDMTIYMMSDKQSKIIKKKISSVRIKKLKHLSQLNELNFNQLYINEAEEILPKITKLYPCSQDIRKFIKEQQQKSTNSKKSEQQSYSNLPQDIRNANKWILRLISILIKGDINRLNKIRQILQQVGIKFQKLEEILHWIVLGSKQICHCYLGEEEPLKHVDTLVLIKLIKESKNSKQLLERFWKFLLKSSKSKEQSQNDGNYTDIHKMVDIFHSVLSTLLHSDIKLLMEKIKILQFQNGDQAKLESAQDEQPLANWFRGYLCEKKFIPRRQIVELKKEGFLEFKNAAKILNQICTYDQDSQVFAFSSSKIYKNIINQFPLKPIKKNYETVYQNTLCFEQKIYFNGQLSKDLVQFLFKADNILPVFDKEWEKYLESDSKDDGKQKYAYLYLFVLVLYDSITKGQNKQLRQRLQFLRQNRQKLSEYTKDSDQIKLINRLLRIQKVQKSNKNEQVVAEGANEQNNNQSTQEQQKICVSCYKTNQKEGNEMVYICKIKKEDTICSVIHGKNSISSTQISTCFHSIHIECFQNLQRYSGKRFKCPLYQIPYNCIVPKQFKKQNKELNNICLKAIIAAIVTDYEIYDAENVFILIFKHLVESNGLNSILELAGYEQRRKLCARNDGFFLKMMKDIYESAEEDEKKQYLESINNFMDEVNKCPHKQSRLIQQLFAEILKDLATGSEISINKKLLIQIRESLVEDEFNVIKGQAERLIGQNGQSAQISLQVAIQQMGTKPKSSLSLKWKSPPQNAKQALKVFSQNCEACQQTSQYFCLTCGKVLCQNCRDAHSSQVHNSITIYLQKSGLRIECNRKDYSSRDNVYYDQFQGDYNDRNTYDDIPSENYLMNQIKYRKIVNKFLSN